MPPCPTSETALCGSTDPSSTGNAAPATNGTNAVSAPIYTAEDLIEQVTAQINAQNAARQERLAAQNAAHEEWMAARKAARQERDAAHEEWMAAFDTPRTKIEDASTDVNKMDAAVNSFVATMDAERDSAQPVEEQKSVTTATTIPAEPTEQSPGNINAGKLNLPSTTKCVQSPVDNTAEDAINRGSTVPEQCSHSHSGSGQRGGTPIVQQWLDSSDESPPPSLSPAPLDGFGPPFQVKCVNLPANVITTKDHIPVENEHWQDTPVEESKYTGGMNYVEEFQTFSNKEDPVFPPD